MLDALLSYVAPHHCCGCGKIGTLLCDNCKYDIVSEPFSLCVACGTGLSRVNGLCGRCRPPYERAWCVAPRQDQVQRLIGNFKFTNAKAAYVPLATLLDSRLPQLPANVKIVPIPTITSHIRQRGYDHALLVAKRLGRIRGLPVDILLHRATNTVQHGVGARLRAAQAKQAFSCATNLDPDVIYLLVDDVITTGATMKYAAKTLRQAGARHIWVATISRQPLD